MADDNIEHPRRGYDTKDVETMEKEAKGKPKRHLGKIILASALLVPALLLALWVAVTLNYSFSSGERVGYVQKFSKKGWLCKTWEGEMAMSTVPGSMPQIFAFSVRDDALAERLQELMRTEEGRVSVTYDQHKGVPTNCFGETEYFVKDVRAVGRPRSVQPVPPAPGATSVTPSPTPPATHPPTTRPPP